MSSDKAAYVPRYAKITISKEASTWLRNILLRWRSSNKLLILKTVISKEETAPKSTASRETNFTTYYFPMSGNSNFNPSVQEWLHFLRTLFVSLHYFITNIAVR